MKEGYIEYQIWEGTPPVTMLLESHPTHEAAADRYMELSVMNPNTKLRLLKAEWAVASVTPLASNF